MANISISVPVGAARSCLREIGADPVECSVDDAFRVLSDLRFSAPASVAAQWFEGRTPAQERSFASHWAAWKREWKRRNSN